MKFRVGDRSFDSARPLLMGIVNVTPDSFSDGGRFLEKERAVERALQLAEDGADMVDIGGESTRPGAEPVETAVELARVIPVVEAAARTLCIPISVDTTKAEVAERALDAGAAMVNDISALRFDARMPDVVAARGASVVLMHMQGVPRTMQVSPQYDRVVEDILGFLHERIAFAAGRGIPKSRIIVDPGIGFGKTLAHNLEILRNADRFHETGCPVMVGASRKKLIELIMGTPTCALHTLGTPRGAAVGERDWGTAALTAWCVIMGVDIQRVHDVKAMRQVCDVTAALNEGSTRVRSGGV